MFICIAQGPEEYQLYVHLQCLGQCRIVHRPCRSRGDECCRSRQLFVGKYPTERISILPSGASSKFHANRHIELTGPDQTAEGFGPGGRGWRTDLRNGSAEWNLPRFRASAWMVPPNSLFRPTASRKHQRAGILPQVVVDRVCGQRARARLRTDACGRKTGQATICTPSDACGRKTDEAANRHYSGLQPQ